MDIDAASKFMAATAKASGLEFAPEKLLTAAAQLAHSVERAPDGAFVYSAEGYASAYRVEKGETVDIPVGEHIAGLIRRNAKPIASKVSPTVEPAPSSSPAPSSAPQWAQRGTGAVSAFARALAEKEDAAVVRETETWANPWLPGSANRTRQQIIINKNPALAARFKAQAGV